MVSRYRFVIAILITFIGFSTGLNMFPIGPITPLIIADYQINNSTAGLLTSIIFLVQIVFAIPLSTLVGKMQIKTMIVLATFLGAAPFLTFMASDNFSLLLLLRAIHGLGLVLLYSAIGPLLIQWFPSRELPLINGGHILAASLGLATSTFLVAPISEVIGWEVVLSGFGAILLLSSFTWFIFGKAAKIPSNNETRSIIRRCWEVFRARNTLLLAVADAGPLTLLTVSMTWLPTFYHETYDMSLIKGGNLMGLLSLSGLLSVILASLLSTRMNKRRPFLIIPGIVTGFAGFAAIMLTDSFAIHIAVILIGFTCWFYIPALMTIIMELYANDPRRIALIIASLMTIGGITSFIAPPMVGAIADLTESFVPGLAIFAFISWSLALAGMLLPETGFRGIKQSNNNQ